MSCSSKLNLTTGTFGLPRRKKTRSTVAKPSTLYQVNPVVLRKSEAWTGESRNH